MVGHLRNIKAAAAGFNLAACRSDAFRAEDNIGTTSAPREIIPDRANYFCIGHISTHISASSAAELAATAGFTEPKSPIVENFP